MGRGFGRGIGYLAAAPMCFGVLCLPPRSVSAEEQASSLTAVVAGDPRATDAAREILRQGGSAMDAAIAAELVLAVVAPDESGLGGGGVILAFDAATQRVSVWDGRETAPAAAGPDLFLDAAGRPLDLGRVSLGGRAVGVPGLLRLLEAAHAKQGKLPWQRLFERAIELARDGSVVGDRLSAVVAAQSPWLRSRPSLAAAFLQPDGAPLAADVRRTDPPLADVLSAVAAGRSDAFYRGDIAADLATVVRTDANPGLMTVDDLGAYAAREREPMCLVVRERRVCVAPPPSAGGIMIVEALGLLSSEPIRYPVQASDQATAVDEAMALIGAEQLAAADAADYAADPDLVPAPVAGLLSPGYLSARARLLDPDKALAEAPPGYPPGSEAPRAPSPSPLRHGTSAVVVMDADGNAVTLNASLDSPFGSGLVVRGIVLNDALTAFSPLASSDGAPVANAVGPGKRPATPVSPVIVLGPTGQVEMALAAGGGERIAARLTNVLVDTLLHGMTLADAADAPQIGADAEGGVVEPSQAALASELRARGQATTVAPRLPSVVGVSVTGRESATIGR